ncbi:LLM class flavin-dependent oxidoreductase, partial [Halorubrum sp. AJ67]|uniref:LLM class flavin-dependent oxidoreductase n=1 Tax=Halorubrum sp. AJ67 TaxID=1173487 RepID=UPI00064E2C23
MSDGIADDAGAPATDDGDADRIGVLFALRDEPELVARAEGLGYESAWAAEGQGKSAFGKLERWAVHTDRIRLATGIVNVFSRTPAAIAQAAATLDAHSGGGRSSRGGKAHTGIG